jgi:imidazole glycerol phosphate synthase subunit HisF
VQFRDHEVVGDILDLAARYAAEGADELVFYDITASPEGRGVDRSWISRIGRLLDIPFCVAGGIRSVAEAEAVLRKLSAKEAAFTFTVNGDTATPSATQVDAAGVQPFTLTYTDGTWVMTKDN